jgi:endoglucanase
MKALTVRLRCAAVAAILVAGMIAAPAPARAEDQFPARRCMNFGNALEAPQEGDWGYTIRKSDIQRISAAHFDTIRVPIAFSQHTDKDRPYAIDPALLTRIDQILDWAQAAHLNVILDVHHYYEMQADPAGESPRWLSMWRQLALRYKSRPRSVIFEVLNEPYGPKMTAEVVQGLQAQVLPIIRKTNPDRWVLLAATNYGTVQGLRGYVPPRDPHTAVSLSFYYPMAFTHQNIPFSNSPIKYGRAWGNADDVTGVAARANEAMNWAHDNKTRLFVVEFGVYENNPAAQRAGWLRTARKAFERRRVGWCVWDFAGEFSIYDKAKEKWKPLEKDGLLR